MNGTVKSKQKLLSQSGKCSSSETDYCNMKISYKNIQGHKTFYHFLLKVKLLTQEWFV